MNEIVAEKLCKKCGEKKPLTDFYTHPGMKDGYLNTCKPCKNIQQKQYPPLPKEISGNLGEQLAVDRMRSLGLFAMTGKMSRWAWQDVIVWGCVRVECKWSPVSSEGDYIFKFDSQARRGMNSHVIVLICDDGMNRSFHVFPSNHPIFFGKDGQRKKGVQYKPFAKHRKLNGAHTMTPDLMIGHKDNWQLIEQERQRIISELVDGIYVDDLKAA